LWNKNPLKLENRVNSGRGKDRFSLLRFIEERGVVSLAPGTAVFLGVLVTIGEWAGNR